MRLRWLMVSALLTLAVALMLVVGGCAQTGSNVESQQESGSEASQDQAAEEEGDKEEGAAPKVRIDQGEGTVEFSDEEGKGRAEVGENVDIPESFPKDLSIYEPSSVISGVETEQPNGRLAGVTLSTSDSPDKVKDFYAAELPKQGYEIKGQISISGTHSIQAKKGDMDVVVTVSADDQGKTLVVINSTTMTEG